MLAERWGIPPWEVTGEIPNQRTRQVWYRRANLYYELRTKQEAKLFNG